MESKQKQKVNAATCAIVCGAPIDNLSWLKDELKSYDSIIAADSGYDHLVKIGITPQVLIGDLDSIVSYPTNTPVIKYPSKKDDTDFSICLGYCLKHQYMSVDVYGAWGNRAGHSLAAIFTMLQYFKLGMKIRILTESSCMFLVSEKCIIPRNNGYVSIFPLNDNASGVTLKGFEYSLNNYDLESCSPLGVSNRILNEFGEISLKTGNLLVIIENE